jgi:hypothetical protein
MYRVAEHGGIISPKRWPGKGKGRTHCRERGHHFVLAYRLYEWRIAVEADRAAIVAKIEEIAELGGVGFSNEKELTILKVRENPEAELIQQWAQPARPQPPRAAGISYGSHKVNGEKTV